MYDNDYKTKENTNWTKDKIEPQHTHVPNAEVQYSNINSTKCNGSRSIYQNSNMTARLYGQTSTFGLVSFVFKSLLRVKTQRNL